jgi:hypothetical protein
MPDEIDSFRSLSKEDWSKIEELERKLVLPPRFCQDLLADDDWSFVIKAHAVVECALSQLLARALGVPQLEKVFARLGTSSPSTGKLAFLKALDIFEEDELRFMRKLSELRNQLVHHVENTSYSFAADFSLRGQEAKVQFIKDFSLPG